MLMVISIKVSSIKAKNRVKANIDMLIKIHIRDYGWIIWKMIKIVSFNSQMDHSIKDKLKMGNFMDMENSLNQEIIIMMETIKMGLKVEKVS